MFSFLELTSVLFLLVRVSYQDQKDPLNDFCRRFGHAPAVIDKRLFIDGGLLNWNPISQNPNNFTYLYLLYASLTTVKDGMPQQYANLTKSSTTPDISGGVLWADEVNKVFYQFGGEYQGSSQPFDALSMYDVLLEQWNQTNIPDDLNRVSFGAGLAVNDRAEGYYLGGWMSSQTMPGWTGNPIATSNLIRYDMIKHTFTNNTGPNAAGRAEGVMVYLPAGDSGLLAYFGGIVDPSRNGTMVASSMSTIYIFDILSGKWYTQTASGNVPDSRRRFCAGATWADDYSSYNIYLYGGLSIPPNTTVFDDVYILSLPSFKWIKWWPTQGPPSDHGHHTLTCNVINRSQMLIMGGTFPNTQDCDAPIQVGTHNMNLGANGPSKSLWDQYNPNITNYAVPPDIIAKIGGGSSGGATEKSPPNWDNLDLQVYFTRVTTFLAHSPTRAIPSATSHPKPIGLTGSRRIGTTIGAALGGLLVLAAIIVLWLWVIKRIKKQRAEKRVTNQQPAELANTSPLTEIYTSTSSEPKDNTTILRPPPRQTQIQNQGQSYFPYGYQESTQPSSPLTTPPPLSGQQSFQIYEMGSGAGSYSPTYAGLVSPPAGVFPMDPYYPSQGPAKNASPRSPRSGRGERRIMDSS